MPRGLNQKQVEVKKSLETKKFPHETDEYKKLQQEEVLTEQNLLSFRDRVYTFEVEDPSGAEPLILHFKKLRAKEYWDVMGKLKTSGIDFTNPTGLTKEQGEQFYAIQCLALGYASGDGKNAQFWLELDDKLIVDTCFTYLMQITNPKDNINWFRRGQQGEKPSRLVLTDEQVPR